MAVGVSMGVLHCLYNEVSELAHAWIAALLKRGYVARHKTVLDIQGAHQSELHLSRALVARFTSW